MDKLKEIVNAYGSPDLQFTHMTDMVIRKSAYICDRTLALGSDKAAIDFSRKLVERIKDSTQLIKITLIAKDY